MCWLTGLQPADRPSGWQPEVLLALCAQPCLPPASPLSLQCPPMHPPTPCSIGWAMWTTAKCRASSWVRCAALRCAALRCAALHCVALRCFQKAVLRLQPSMPACQELTPSPVLFSGGAKVLCYLLSLHSPSALASSLLCEPLCYCIICRRSQGAIPTGPGRCPVRPERVPGWKGAARSLPAAALSCSPQLRACCATLLLLRPRQLEAAARLSCCCAALHSLMVLLQSTESFPAEAPS